MMNGNICNSLISLHPEPFARALPPSHKMLLTLIEKIAKYYSEKKNENQ